MDPSIENHIRNGTTPLSQALPAEVLLSAVNFSDAETRARNKEGVPPSAGMELLTQIMKIERPFRTRLEQLAVQLVTDEFGITGDALTFDAQLVDPELSIGKSEQEEEKSDEVDPALADEIAKRRLINALIQGGAHHIQHSFFLKANELREMHPRLPELYRDFMALADQAYFDLPTEVTDEMALSISPIGLVELDFLTTPITVVARAWVCPVLIHEIGKGTIECLALHGLPEDGEVRRQVLQAADKLEYEAWDLRVGPGLWRALNLTLLKGVRLHDRAEKLKEFFMLPAQDFLSRMRAIGAQLSAEKE